MFIEVSRTMFQDALNAYYSYEAIDILFDFFDAEDIEFDPVAIRCEYNEGTYDEVANDYFDGEYKDGTAFDSDDDEHVEWLIDELNASTLVIGITDYNSVVYAAY